MDIRPHLQCPCCLLPLVWRCHTGCGTAVPACSTSVITLFINVLLVMLSPQTSVRHSLSKERRPVRVVGWRQACPVLSLDSASSLVPVAFLLSCHQCESEGELEAFGIALGISVGESSVSGRSRRRNLGFLDG
jgi:hypothetical protein